jgi:glycosyltransferase involved in cell wall biosynthesis
LTLRILHITHSLGFGGVETQLATLAQAATRDEHEFCAIHDGGDASDTIRSFGGRTEVVGIDPWRRPLHALLELVRLIRSSKPDIVHCHGYEANIWGVLAARLAGIRKVIAEEIGIWDRSWRSRSTIRFVYGFAQRVVATSEAVKQFLQTDGVKLEKISVIYNPVRFSSSSAQQRPESASMKIGCVGRLHHVKNPIALVRATNLLRADGLPIEVHFIGDGPQRSDLQAQATNLGLSSVVHFHGYQSDPFEILAGCHLYVQPSPAEGFGIAIVEAMSCGLSVICSRLGAASEFVEHGRHGWLINDVDPQTIAAAIRVAESLDRKQLYEMGKLAERSVRSRFTTPRYVENLEKLYDSLV